jgi:RimJ/RimL family protein N-acetyltransferase
MEMVQKKAEFTTLCDEPEGNVARSVTEFDYTPQAFFKLWQKASQFPILFGSEISKDFNKFLEIFVMSHGGQFSSNGLIWIVDDYVGAFYMTDIYAPHDAKVHYSFFDRRFKGRVNLVRDMLKHVFNKYKMNRLSAEIPTYASPAVYEFIESVGFKKEGRKRKAAEFKGELVDVRLFGILPEDLNGR